MYVFIIFSILILLISNVIISKISIDRATDSLFTDCNGACDHGFHEVDFGLDAAVGGAQVGAQAGTQTGEFAVVAGNQSGCAAAEAASDCTQVARRTCRE